MISYFTYFFKKDDISDLNLFSRPSRKFEQPTSKFYNNIRPIDSKHLTNYLTNDLMGGSDLKFVAWDDFDNALENDSILFHKLHSIGKTQSYDDLLDLVRNVGDLSVITLNEDVPENRDSLFYRTDRSFDNNFIRILSEKPENQKNNLLNKEKIEY